LHKGLSELVSKTENKTFLEADIRKASIIAFELYDTYGIPWKLTSDWAEIHGIKIDRKIFDEELEKQKIRSKAQSAMQGDVFSGKLVDFGKGATKFSGYESYSEKAKVLKIIMGKEEAKKINRGDEATIILDKTPFYPESGGQVGDTGELVKGKNKFHVLDTKKSQKVILHIGKVSQGSFKINDSPPAVMIHRNNVGGQNL